MAGLDEAGSDHGGDLLLNFGLLKMRVSVRLNVNGVGVGEEMYVVLDMAVRGKGSWFFENVGKLFKDRDDDGKGGKRIWW